MEIIKMLAKMQPPYDLIKSVMLNLMRIKE